MTLEDFIFFLGALIVNKNTLTKTIFAVLMFASTLAVAEEYPATNYQPTVLFHDEAANSKAKQNQPKAVAAPAKAATASAPAASSIDRIDTASAPASESGGSNGLLFILLGAGAAGFFLFKNKSSAQSTSSSAYNRDPNGLSGVARYLKSLEQSNGTGVARYIDKQVAAAKAQAEAAAEAARIAAESTGVAKYIKQNASEPKATQVSEDTATGVAKYLRDRA